MSGTTRSPSIPDAVDHLRSEGYVVLADLVGGHDLEAIEEELSAHLAGAPFGRNDFEGFRTQRAYALLAKAPTTAKLVAHPAVLAVLDEVLDPAYLLSANIAINVHPGETAQMLHGDDGYCPLPRPRRAVGVSAVWAIDEFTRRNGATEVIPGSHLWAEHAADPHDPRIRTIEMSPGSVVVFFGTTLHRGGAHHGSAPRLGITPQYCQPWVRQVENMALAIPPALASTLPERVQSLLYGILPPFIGYADGRDPVRALRASPR
jgi:ectoine hydroxylase-related dioxygenase (phytanoyl-CoA dioxygenase family)